MDTYASLANLLDCPSSPMLIPTTPPNSPAPIFRIPPPAPARPTKAKYRVCHISKGFRAASRILFQDEIFKPRPGEITHERLVAAILKCDNPIDFNRFFCDECGFTSSKCCWKSSTQTTCDVIECPVCGVYSPVDEDWIMTQ